MRNDNQRCYKCLRIQPFSAFYADKSRYNLRSGCCKKCHVAFCRQRYYANRRASQPKLRRKEMEFVAAPNHDLKRFDIFQQVIRWDAKVEYTNE